ncbi:hypothetical protein BB560_006280, partial [Smittium megazygosporum]
QLTIHKYTTTYNIQMAASLMTHSLFRLEFINEKRGPTALQKSAISWQLFKETIW